MRLIVVAECDADDTSLGVFHHPDTGVGFSVLSGALWQQTCTCSEDFSLKR